VDSKVYVAGLVAFPGSYDYSPSISVEQYLSMAGGSTWNGSAKSATIHRDGKIINKSSVEHMLAGDIINVPPRKLAKLNEFLGIFGGIMAIIIAAKAAGVY